MRQRLSRLLRQSRHLHLRFLPCRLYYGARNAIACFRCDTNLRFRKAEAAQFIHCCLSLCGCFKRSDHCFPVLPHSCSFSSSRVIQSDRQSVSYHRLAARNYLTSELMDTNANEVPLPVECESAAFAFVRRTSTIAALLYNQPGVYPVSHAIIPAHVMRTWLAGSKAEAAPSALQKSLGVRKRSFRFRAANSQQAQRSQQRGPRRLSSQPANGLKSLRDKQPT